MRELRGRVAVVTGASSGIGRSLADRLARQGCVLALVDLAEEGLEESARRARSHGATVTTHVMDVTDADAWVALRNTVCAVHGEVHLLVNNAGVSVTGPFVTTPLADLRWQQAVNLDGVWLGCHTFLPHLLQRDEAHVVNISSLFGLVGVPWSAAYCASKFAVRGLTEALSSELHGSSVRFTCVHPGAVATAIVSGGRFHGGGPTLQQASQTISRGLSPNRAADQIVDGILRSRERVLVGWDARIGDWLQRMFPVVFRWFVRRLAQRVRRSQRRQG